MGVAQNLLSASATARGYDGKKNLTLANGEAVRNKAYSAAAGAELAARANALVEGANMMTMRGNQRRAEGAWQGLRLPREVLVCSKWVCVRRFF